MATLSTLLNQKYINDPKNPNASIPNPNYQAPNALTTALGQKAATPVNNVAPQSNTLSYQYVQNPNAAALKAIQDELAKRQAENVAPNQTRQQAEATPATGGTTGTTTPTYDPNNAGLYGQLIAALANKSNQASTDYTTQQNLANNYNQALQTSRTNEAQGLAANALNPIPLEFQQGRGQVLQTQYAQEQAALGSAFQGASTLQQAANTQQQLQQQGLTSAAGLASPQQVGYNVQYLNPLTGQQVGGGATGTLPQSAQDAVNSYAQQVKNGQMTRADAESRLSAYGVAGTNALNTALGTGFNTNASNASAGTTAVGQQIQTQSGTALAALDTLQNLFNSLPGIQTGGFPATNSIMNSIASALGSSALSSYKVALADARAQLEGVLTATGATTPSGAESMALTYLPDNMTPSQLQGNLQAVKQLIQQKVEKFTQSGQQQNGTSTNSNNIWDF